MKLKFKGYKKQPPYVCYRALTKGKKYEILNTIKSKSKIWVVMLKDDRGIMVWEKRKFFCRYIPWWVWLIIGIAGLVGLIFLVKFGLTEALEYLFKAIT